MSQIARIAHFSDLHLDDNPRNTERTLAILQFLHKIEKSLDLVLITGDIAEYGRIEDYETLLLLMEKSGLSCPVLCCPGNADDVDNFHTILQAGSDSINQMYRLPGVSVLSCDSVIPRESAGILADTTLAWLEEILAQETQPVILAMHHPPILIGIAELDIFRLQNSPDLAEVISKYPQVIAILCGHTHTNTTTLFAGIPVHIVQGVAFPNALWMLWNEAAFPNATANPIPIAFHIIENGSITTHCEYVPN